MNAVEFIREAGSIALLAYVLTQNRPLLQELMALLKETNKAVVSLEREIVAIKLVLDKNK